MKKISFLALALALAIFPLIAESAPEKVPVLSSLQALKRSGIKPLAADPSIDVGYALVSEREQAAISQVMHEAGKCAGYELLAPGPSANALNVLAELSHRVKKDRAYLSKRVASAAPVRRPEIEAATAELKAENIQANVEWLSSFPSRYNKLTDPNQHVIQLEARLRDMMKDFSGNWSVEQISHSSTRQRSLKLRLEGKSRPQEIVVLGGHLDSISGWSGSGRAPGADDNASGSGSLMEAVRVLAKKGAAERTVEIFWYAGEESGLLGSAEIARQYKSSGKNVVAVLQLDMTLFPGSGQLVIGNVDDFTSPWLRELLVGWNDLYIGARLIPDRCGYACSDHASWYRQGYPTLMPFESDTEHMNSNIHTERDVISSSSSFQHALAFAKIALVMAMDLGNSTVTQGY